MAVIYLFDAQKRLKRPVKDVVEVIHKEGEYNATAMVDVRQTAEYGDSFGFLCADGRFRLFLINGVEKNDEAGYTSLTGYDAALAELNSKVVVELELERTDMREAVEGALEGTGFAIGTLGKDEKLEMKNAYFQTAWAVLRNIATVGGVRVVPYYEFSGGSIVGRKVDFPDKTPVFRGVILTRRKGARNIHITKEGMPYGRVYPVGKIITSGDPPEQVTIADATWSIAAGDPADKPAGQLWVALPGAVTDAEYVFEDKREEDSRKLLEKGFADLQKTAKPKASGTATIGDVEHVPGWEHRGIRMWDLLPVRTEDGETVEATVVNIARYMVHKELTKVTIGDEDDQSADLESLLASMNETLEQTAVSAGGAGAGAGEAKNMVLRAEESITLLSKRVEVNAEEIELRAHKTTVEALESETLTKFNETYLRMDATDLRLGATETVVDNIGNEVETARAEISVNAEEIAALVRRADGAEAAIEVNADEIALRVQKDGVIAAINVSPEEGVKINARKVDLGDYATVGRLEAEMLNVNSIFAGEVEIRGLWAEGTITAAKGDFTSIEVSNWPLSLLSGNFVTSVTFPAYQENTIYYTNSAGQADQMRVLTPTKTRNGSYSKSDSHFYLGRTI